MTAFASAERCITLPRARGPWTDALYRLLSPDLEPDVRELERIHALEQPDQDPLDPLYDDDLQMALCLCYELHYTGFVGVDTRMEWSPLVLMLRAALEERFAKAVQQVVELGFGPMELDFGSIPDSVGQEIQRLVREDDGPPLSRYAEREASPEQLLEHVIHRSAYQLKEADPHSWAIPRLTGGPKAALVEIQSDEYGGGRPERIHASLFAQTMRGLGLDDSYGAYLDRLPGITLATANLMSWFGLHRRWRGALAGHLAVFEMTSSVPNRRYANGFRRVGCGPDVTEFYDEHVEADAVHENIAVWDLADALGRGEPLLAPDIVFGARALLAVEGGWAQHVLDAWRSGQTSLRPVDVE